MSRTTEFRNAGVKEEEMQRQIENVRQHLGTDFSNLNDANKALIEEEIQKLLQDTEKAKKMVYSAYRQVDQEEK